jgi:hypothetical protein
MEGGDLRSEREARSGNRAPTVSDRQPETGVSDGRSQTVVTAS